MREAEGSGGQAGHELQLSFSDRPRDPRTQLLIRVTVGKLRPRAVAKLSRSHSEFVAKPPFPSPALCRASWVWSLASYHHLVPAGSGTVWSRLHRPQHWLQLCSLDRDVGREFPADTDNCHCPHSFWFTCVTSNQPHHPSEPQMPNPCPSSQARAIGKPGLCAMMTHSHIDAKAIPAKPGVPLLPLQTSPRLRASSSTSSLGLAFQTIPGLFLYMHH